MRCSTNDTYLLSKGTDFYVIQFLWIFFGHVTKMNFRGLGLSENFAGINFSRHC